MEPLRSSKLGKTRPTPKTHNAEKVCVRYTKNVRKPQQMQGVEGEIKELDKHLAEQLIREGYAQKWQISVSPQPTSRKPPTQT